MQPVIEQLFGVLVAHVPGLVGPQVLADHARIAIAHHHDFRAIALVERPEAFGLFLRKAHLEIYDLVAPGLHQRSRFGDALVLEDVFVR